METRPQQRGKGQLGGENGPGQHRARSHSHDSSSQHLPHLLHTYLELLTIPATPGNICPARNMLIPSATASDMAIFTSIK